MENGDEKNRNGEKGGGNSTRGLISLTPSALLGLANALALALSEGQTADEINAAGNFLTAVGALMIAAAGQIL